MSSVPIARMGTEDETLDAGQSRTPAWILDDESANNPGVQYAVTA
jgi:hypothetical protein